ncbi:hypothetical protein CC78DRAFT_595826 [Lojkania enalia]|uniref:Uncharacterized protein n=1 Tax=Lojkania enalia TaxID=147567 RepID=A0A9P4JYT4_9PLEO|nr:hypothetical protein CC78DRAFT_595826 [Didymosphaeria enalia]
MLTLTPRKGGSGSSGGIKNGKGAIPSDMPPDVSQNISIVLGALSAFIFLFLFVCGKAIFSNLYLEKRKPKEYFLSTNNLLVLLFLWPYHVYVFLGGSTRKKRSHDIEMGRTRHTQPSAETTARDDSSAASRMKPDAQHILTSHSSEADTPRPNHAHSQPPEIDLGTLARLRDAPFLAGTVDTRNYPWSTRSLHCPAYSGYKRVAQDPAGPMAELAYSMNRVVLSASPGRKMRSSSAKESSSASEPKSLDSNGMAPFHLESGCQDVLGGGKKETPRGCEYDSPYVVDREVFVVGEP